jgi:hypothetical protein
MDRMVSLEVVQEKVLGRFRRIRGDIMWDFEGLVRAVNYSRPQVAWLIRTGRIPYLRFGRKKWFLAGQVETALRHAKAAGAVRGPMRGAKEIVVRQPTRALGRSIREQPV